MRLLRMLPLVVTACASHPASLSGTGVRETAEDAAFHQDPRWLGADGAYTIDLGDGRVLWLFGDSFIATTSADSRSASTMVRNSIAVMTGHDLLTASMQFAWTASSPPDAFVTEDGSNWFWPADGVRVPNGPLVMFMNEQTSSSGGLGFAATGYHAVIVSDPSGAPTSWQPASIAVAPAPYDATAAVACSVVDPASDTLVALLVDGSNHHGRLVRWPMASVAAGDLTSPAWWSGSQWTSDGSSVAVVIDNGATECSLSQLADGTWLHVSSQGFGATTIAIRTAPRIEGPWSDPDDVFEPPESQVPNAFVYAGKAHPTLTTHAPDATLVVSYANNSFTFSDLFAPANVDTLYWPHVAELTLR
jgi:hypothetical protein